MKDKVNQVWYSYWGTAYQGNDPAYYYPENFDWTAVLQKEFDMIKEEVMTYVQTHTLPSYFNTSLVSTPNGWKTPILLSWGTEHHEISRNFPLLTKTLKKINGLLSCSISVLEPHTSIKEHFGDTNAIIRNHWAISIPTGLPYCGIKVNGIEKEWKEGEIISFCDAYLHSAWNQSALPRVVIIFDTLKKEYIEQKLEICANVTSGFWLQKISLRFKLIHYLPGKWRGKLRRKKAAQLLKRLKTNLI